MLQAVTTLSSISTLAQARAYVDSVMKLTCGGDRDQIVVGVALLFMVLRTFHQFSFIALLVCVVPVSTKSCLSHS